MARRADPLRAAPGDTRRGHASEAFKPIAIRPPSANRWLFALRRVVDLQLLTTYSFLAKELPHCRGRVLDVGAGETPWRELLAQADYVGLDVESAADFGMHQQPDVVYYDGGRMPFPDASFDHLLCSEVLEHVPDPRAFAVELARVLRVGGSLILTVPWSARLHHLPNDHHRFTRFALLELLASAGFGDVRIDERGNDVAVIANKLIVMMIRLLRPRRWFEAVWCWPLALVLAPVAAAFLLAAHVSIAWRLGSPDDPLGYGVVATRR